MKRQTLSIRAGVRLLAAGMLALAFASCDTTPAKNDAPNLNRPAAALPTIRIKAGVDAPMTDTKGVKWAADTDYVDGGTPVDRPDLAITGTDKPELYRIERYSMNSYSIKVPNGNYTVKLHFSEDYDGIASPADRLFTYAVKDGTATTGKTIKEVKDFGPWKASGAQFKAYVDSVPVTVTAGQITITFTPQLENPQINALEIIPR